MPPIRWHLCRAMRVAAAHACLQESHGRGILRRIGAIGAAFSGACNSAIELGARAVGPAGVPPVAPACAAERLDRAAVGGAAHAHAVRPLALPGSRQ